MNDRADKILDKVHDFGRAASEMHLLVSTKPDDTVARDKALANELRIFNDLRRDIRALAAECERMRGEVEASKAEQKDIWEIVDAGRSLGYEPMMEALADYCAVRWLREEDPS